MKKKHEIYYQIESTIKILVNCTKQNIEVKKFCWEREAGHSGYSAEPLGTE